MKPFLTILALVGAFGAAPAMADPATLAALQEKLATAGLSLSSASARAIGEVPLGSPKLAEAIKKAVTEAVKAAIEAGEADKAATIITAFIAGVPDQAAAITGAAITVVVEASRSDLAGAITAAAVTAAIEAGRLDLVAAIIAAAIAAAPDQEGVIRQAVEQILNPSQEQQGGTTEDQTPNQVEPPSPS